MSDGTGPFLVVIHNDYKTEAHIVKVLPDDNWWYGPRDEEGDAQGYGVREDDTRISIFDMSKRNIQGFPGAPAGFITFDETVREL